MPPGSELPTGLAASPDPGFLPEPMALDIETSLFAALDGGTVFSGGQDPLPIFQHTLAAALHDFEVHPRGVLLRRFLTEGPYSQLGEIPPGSAMSDEEVDEAIAFVRSFMVPTFQGALAELLAAGPCLRLLDELLRHGEIPGAARLYAGDSVRAPVKGRLGFWKAADFHALVEDSGAGTVTVAAVGEVKSYRRFSSRLGTQLEQHAERAVGGLEVAGAAFPPERVQPAPDGRPVVGIRIVPDDWTLPRSFRFDENLLWVTPPEPPSAEDRSEKIGPRQWQITLRWSHEALAEAAYELSFWYMERIGEVAFATTLPAAWAEMSPAEAGRNAAKMMLYYAIRRAFDRYQETADPRHARAMGRAIALYNTYGFGYALGMSFKDRHRRRQMLWVDDLMEILATGRNKDGCRIVEPHPRRPRAG